LHEKKVVGKCIILLGSTTNVNIDPAIGKQPLIDKNYWYIIK